MHFFPIFFAPRQFFSEKVYKWSKNCLAIIFQTFFSSFFEFGTIFLLRVARNLRSPNLSRLEVSRDLELKNKATITGLGLGLVAEMNMVELGLVAAMDLVELGLVVVYGDGISGLGLMVVYGDGI